MEETFSESFPGLNISNDRISIDLSSKLADFKMNFYKETNNMTSPTSLSSSGRITKSLFSYPKCIRRKDDRINKGVSHKIKKPKFSKKKEVKKNKAKQSFTRMKELKLPPRMPSNRSPLKPGQKGKRHILTSPGMSLLDSPDLASELKDPKMKFFTSRSRDPATIKISETIKLAAKNGAVKIAQREGGFEKRNIGHTVELELEKRIAATSLNLSVNGHIKLEEIPKMSSAQHKDPRPVLTRFPGSPSPNKNKLKSFSMCHRIASPKRTQVKSPLVRPLVGVLRSPSRSRRSPYKQVGDKSKECRENEMNSDALLPISPKKGVTSVQMGYTSDKKKCLLKETLLHEGDPKGFKDLVIEIEGITPIRDEEDEILTSLILENVSPEKVVTLPIHPIEKNAVDSLSQSSRHSVVISCKNVLSSSPGRSSFRLTKKNQSIQIIKPLNSKENESLSSQEASINGERAQLSKNDNENVKYFPIFDSGRKMNEKSSKCKENILKSLPRKRFVLKRSDDSQRILDAGQKDFGATFCKDCGLMYETGNPEDEASHLRHHDKIIDALKFNGWKNEKQVTNLDHRGGRIIKISPTDPAYQWKKVKEILLCVDSDLGFSENGVKDQSKTYAYLYILNKLIVGCLIAEIIEKAYKVIQQKISDNDVDNGRLVCCSDITQPVCVGISRIWVLPAHRRKGIASQLVDTMRANCVIGHYIADDKFAFSDPTQYGMAFAEKYTKKPDFLVYRRE